MENKHVSAQFSAFWDEAASLVKGLAANFHTNEGSEAASLVKGLAANFHTNEGSEAASLVKGLAANFHTTEGSDFIPAKPPPLQRIQTAS